jgi:hypothetical protein
MTGRLNPSAWNGRTSPDRVTGTLIGLRPAGHASSRVTAFWLSPALPQLCLAAALTLPILEPSLAHLARIGRPEMVRAVTPALLLSAALAVALATAPPAMPPDHVEGPDRFRPRLPSPVPRGGGRRDWNGLRTRPGAVTHQPMPCQAGATGWRGFVALSLVVLTATRAPGVLSLTLASPGRALILASLGAMAALAVDGIAYAPFPVPMRRRSGNRAGVPDPGAVGRIALIRMLPALGSAWAVWYRSATRRTVHAGGAQPGTTEAGQGHTGL